MSETDRQETDRQEPDPEPPAPPRPTLLHWRYEGDTLPRPPEGEPTAPGALDPSLKPVEGDKPPGGSQALRARAANIIPVRPRSAAAPTYRVQQPRPLRRPSTDAVPGEGDSPPPVPADQDDTTPGLRAATEDLTALQDATAPPPPVRQGDATAATPPAASLDDTPPPVRPAAAGVDDTPPPVRPAAAGVDDTPSPVHRDDTVPPPGRAAGLRFRSADGDSTVPPPSRTIGREHGGTGTAPARGSGDDFDSTIPPAPRPSAPAPPGHDLWRPGGEDDDQRLVRTVQLPAIVPAAVDAADTTTSPIPPPAGPLERSGGSRMRRMAPATAIALGALVLGLLAGVALRALRGAVADPPTDTQLVVPSDVPSPEDDGTPPSLRDTPLVADPAPPTAGESPSTQPPAPAAPAPETEGDERPRSSVRPPLSPRTTPPAPSPDPPPVVPPPPPPPPETSTAGV